MKQKILPIIAAGFGLACLLQFGNLTNAKAAGSEQTNSIADTHAETPGAPQDIVTANAPSAQCLTATVATAVQEQKELLETKLLGVEKREVALKALDSRLQTDLVTLTELKTSVEAQVAQLRKVSEGDLKHLVQMYSTMKPQNAAEIFDNMPAAFAAGFLREMDGARAGMVMSEMNTKKSFEISLIIANSNAQWR